jgi:hypothetical protein
MKSKTLNFPDAMKLASIVSKYIDIMSIPEMTGEEFGYELFSLMDVDDVLAVEELLLEDYGDSSPQDIILQSLESMVENNLLDLLKTYEQLGFK